MVSVDSRIYRAFFAHTRHETRKNDKRGRGSNEHREATRKLRVRNKRESQYTNIGRRRNEHSEPTRKLKV
jgi:hypothetical protein